MKNLLKIDLYRSIFNCQFLFACLLGSLIAISNFVQQVFPAFLRNNRLAASNFSQNLPPANVFQVWLGANPVGMEQFLYYLLLPIIAVLPYADSYFIDKKTGYLKNFLIRVTRKDYFISRYIAAFISGGLAFSIPLLINFLVTNLLLPSMAPDPYYSSIGETSMWNTLYYSEPIFYTLLFIIMAFLFSGAFSTISLLISDFVEHRFIVVIFPFLLYIAFFSIMTYISTNSQMLAWIPEYFLTPSFPYANFKIVLLEFMILLLGTFLGVVWKGIKRDALD
ncbi:hypothetical protein CAFE_32640 [Caprobacter fermentans]|uniref:Uncharacterized protein n=1 Tax=Caproicibacter fermentans TaxID=2576756 RepID=A0A6N8I370_9FIRM|nr:hypothetical protein [Caproicibacter fermentans]MVB12524.1 hypothetical protein [Caproicibacter fermentans]OCN00915.1 hypothetical protein A7X67_09070 [Clostridium sp. W14A]QNK42044.1 hypothetical protein HCR03_07400 [Caproicibacter fermentans]